MKTLAELKALYELPLPELPLPELPLPELPLPDPEPPELPDPELLVVLVEVLWIFHSPFWRTTSILVVPWMAE